MKPDWERIKEIFSVALEKNSPVDREHYLAGSCQGQPELRQQVESLLKANEQAGEFFKTFSPPPFNFEFEHAGVMIGRYKLLQQIGGGGGGDVYRAEQETPVRRFVALKIIQIGMNTPKVIARFELERQVLAIMDHPNIAKVFDAGATDTGRPYFVMELVTGVPITEYCNEQKLSIKERLELFVPVCQAIQHAHEQKIIHRDIKPSNVLVALFDKRPVPKVIDFGIAKATQQSTDNQPLTDTDQFIGTPIYMSPEQAGLKRYNISIDARSDIYSLGVLLYELLVGQPPFPADLPQDEIRRAIRENEPLWPSGRFKALGEEERLKSARSRKANPYRLIRSLRGDLGCIVMKCLEKDGARRYQTANTLAAEIQHYLKHEPITAHPPSIPYRFQKLVQRHRLQFAAAVIAILFILGIIVSLIAIPNLVTKKILTSFGVDSLNISRVLEEMRQRVKSHSIPLPIVKESPLSINSPLPLIPPITNTTKPKTIPTLGGTGGQIRILSGTGDFAPVSDANNVLNVSAGATLNGTIGLSVLNLGPGDAIAPLIFTPSWGDHSSSWRQINRSVPTGQSKQQAQISLVVPTTPGIYHIIIAMCWEVGGDHVASGTSWGIGKDLGYGWINNYDVWNDGNDIADFNEDQISSAQSYGWATNSEMLGPDATHATKWYQPRPYPSDAITLIVTENGVSPAARPTPGTEGSPPEIIQAWTVTQPQQFHPGYYYWPAFGQKPSDAKYCGTADDLNEMNIKVTGKPKW